MYYLDVTSFAVGILTGIAGAFVAVGFVAVLMSYAGADVDKRGLSARTARQDRHRAVELWGSELDGPNLSALPVLDPLTTPVEQLLAQADLLVPPYVSPGPGSSTVAGSKPPRRNVKPKPLTTTSRSRPESSSGVLPPT